MAHRAWFAFLGVLGLVAPSCGDGGGGGGDADADTDTDTGTADGLPFGSPCTSDSECADGACAADACTRECDDYSDCPEPDSRCGIRGDRVVCGPAEAEGSVGQNCTFDPCPAGMICYRRGDVDPNAICSHECADASECPAGFICEGTIENPTAHCRPAAFCDPCAVDDDCGIGGRCLVAGTGERYCSIVCDLALSTCPAGGTCVAQGSGDPACEPAAGTCGPTGELCSTCASDADCDAGGYCLSDDLSGGVFCGSPCSTDSDCPVEHYCNTLATLVLGGTAPDPQCYPRTGDCGNPSRGGTMCFPCDSIADCYNGRCITIGFTRVCGEDCAENGDADCPVYSSCQTIFGGGGVEYRNCLPGREGDDLPCFLWQQCLDDLGAGLCTEDAECISGDCSGG